MIILRELKFSRRFTAAPPVLEELCRAVVVKKEPQGKKFTRWRVQAAKIEIGGGAQSRVAAPWQRAKVLARMLSGRLPFGYGRMKTGAVVKKAVYFSFSCCAASRAPFFAAAGVLSRARFNFPVSSVRSTLRLPGVRVSFEPTSRQHKWLPLYAN